MEPDCSLPCSQEPFTGPSPETDEIGRLSTNPSNSEALYNIS
jgi:hypothetical protein